MWAFCLTFSLVENDAVEYATLAQILYREKSLALYPFFSADPMTGFQSSSSHPLGYVGFILWGYLLQGTSKTAHLMRLINPYYFCLLIFLMRNFSSLKQRSEFFLLATPFLWVLAVGYHIDILRIFFLTFSFFLLKDLKILPSLENKIFLIFASSFALYSHSIGIFVLFFIPFFYFLFIKEEKKVRNIILIFLCICLIGGWNYLDNFIKIGALISDSNLIWSLPEIRENLDVLYRRNLYTYFDLIFVGVLQGFSKIHWFGFNFWMSIASSYMLIRFKNIKNLNNHEDVIYKISSWFFYLYHGSALGTLLLGSDLMIKNPRYYLTLSPFTAYMAASYMQMVSQRMIKSIIQGVTFIFWIYAWGGCFKKWMTYPFFSTGVFVSQEFESLFYTDKNMASFWKFVRDLKNKGKILVFEQNNLLFYTGKKIVRDLDSRMLPFYKMKDPEEAVQYLKKTGIQYIYAPPHISATLYNSTFSSLLNNPSFTYLLKEINGHKLFEFRQAHVKGFKNLALINESQRYVFPYFSLTLFEKKTKNSRFFSRIQAPYFEKVEIKTKIFAPSQEGIIRLKAKLKGTGMVEISVQDPKKNILSFYFRTVVFREKDIEIFFQSPKKDFNLLFLFYQGSSIQVESIKCNFLQF